MLFPINPTENILPYDGTVNYFGKVLTKAEADNYYEKLFSTLDWKHDEAIILGKHFVTPRKVAWYADEPYSYTYSKITKQALPWTTELIELKKLAEKITGAKYNSCLANLYHNGNEGMAWHSDDEKTLDRKSAIASISFGAERKFCFKHKADKNLISIYLEHGSLLVMKEETQINWMHRLPPTKKIFPPRINFTFRTMIV